MKPKKMPRQKPSTSRQDYQTPVAFLGAVEARFGPIVFDLACTKANSVAQRGFFHDLGFDGIAEDWTHLAMHGEVLWLNPPFGQVAKWAEKCAAYAGRGLVTLLVPAAVGTEYFAAHIYGRARVFPIRPRLTFVGETDPFIKDLMLCVYGQDSAGFQPWRWK